MYLQNGLYWFIKTVSWHLVVSMNHVEIFKKMMKSFEPSTT